MTRKDEETVEVKLPRRHTPKDRAAAVMALAPLANPIETEKIEKLSAIVDKAQNGPPLGPGDGSLSPREWAALRDVVKAAREYQAAITKACEALTRS